MKLRLPISKWGLSLVGIYFLVALIFIVWLARILSGDCSPGYQGYLPCGEPLFGTIFATIFVLNFPWIIGGRFDSSLWIPLINIAVFYTVGHVIGKLYNKVFRREGESTQIKHIEISLKKFIIALAIIIVPFLIAYSIRLTRSVILKKGSQLYSEEYILQVKEYSKSACETTGGIWKKNTQRCRATCIILRSDMSPPFSCYSPAPETCDCGDGNCWNDKTYKCEPI